MIWQTDGLPKQPLEEVLEPEMVKQYRIRRGQQCAFMPVFVDDRWLCSCGAENVAGENCHACGLSPEPLTRQVLEQLRQDAAVRLEEEEKTRDQREEAERRAELAAKRRKRWRKVAVWAACVVGILALTVGAWAFLRYGLPALYYRQALAALEQQDIPEAHRLFVLASGYKDADAYLSRFYTPLRTAVGTTNYTDEAQFDDLMPEKIQTTALYTYDSFGRLLTTKEETLQSDWQESEQTAYTNTYDEKGNRLVQENSFGKTVRQYDDHGSIRSEENYRPDGTHSYSKIFVIAYDDQGRIVASSEVCSDRVLVNYSYEQHLTFTYDDRGNLVKQTNVTNFPATSESNYEVTTRWTYNERNDPVFMESDMICADDPVDNCREETTWAYDAEGRLLRQDALKEYPNNPLATYRTVRTCSYDGAGNVLSDITVSTFPNDPDRDYEESTVRTYDRDGRVTEQRTGVRYTGAERDLFSGFSSVETYTYDFLGRLKEKVLVREYTNTDLSYTQSYAYTYGLDGTLRKAKEVYRGHREDTEENYEAITHYNENGLPQKVETVSDTFTNTREYTYGYYYYPEGVEMPRNDAVTTEMLYG